MPPAIFIVDDDEAIRYLVTEVLEQEGYRAVALEAEEVLERAVAAPPALILLDVMMPGLDGPHVAALLRAHPETARLPIVIMTAFVHADQRYAAMGAAAVLRKPFALDELLALVRRFAPKE